MRTFRKPSKDNLRLTAGKERKNMENKILVETSARHIHLTQEAVEALFGAGHTLTKKKDLSQPGQFACEEKVTVVNKCVDKRTGAEVEKTLTMSVLGPVRPETQVEVSFTDARTLGVSAPVRESGDVAGTPGAKLVGPAGEYVIDHGIIVAKRHIHLTPENAADLGVENGQIVKVLVDTGAGRKTVFDDVVIRVKSSFAPAMHIDTDECIPEEGKWIQAKEISDISAYTHGVGWCAPQQGACKLSLNVKNGIIEEALVETIGCSGMTHSAAMAAEILPGKTILEALNTDLVCDAINTAMRELFLQIVYGRSQSAFSENGLVVGAGMEDLGKGARSMVGTMYGTKAKGVRYLEMTEGYCTRMALDENDQVIGYEFVSLGKMTDMIKKGTEPNEAYEKAKGTYGRFKPEDGAVKYIDPRKE